ncbi:F0F1 ATP synthase subunit A [Gordonia sp. VNQ95]|jgi:F-type H+-transporting ATPase subunit a|uniref:F0F1 ATP synthase subunit A n=1 Tax=Gordonia sp. VNQ95 TaxID=3156619 RepID=UPI0032B5679D
MTAPSDTLYLAEAKIEVGHHQEVEWLGLTWNLDTIIAAAIAGVIVIAMAFFVKAKMTSKRPNTVQLYFEVITVQMRNQIESAIGMKIAGFVLPLAVTLFTYILIVNWFSVLPVQYGTDDGSTHELIKPASGDANFTYALAIFVFCWYHAAGMKRRGPLRHLGKLVKGHAAGLAPINIIEEIAKPLSLSLRLFGNLFAGGVMVALIALFPAYIMWFPNAIWKSFDMFIGLIQAFIFALLTILYFSQAMEDDHH